MTYVGIEMKPGIYSEATDRTAKGRWKKGINTRFFKSLPETMGGSVIQNDDDAPLKGVGRVMHAFRSLLGYRYLFIGTHASFELYNGAEIVDITPLRDSGTITNAITTVAGSTTVTVADTAHGLAVGDIAHLVPASSVGGAVFGPHVFVTSVTTNTYTFELAVAATSGATGGGSIAYSYLIPTGRLDSGSGDGWGTGDWRSINSGHTDSRAWGGAEPGGSDILIPARTLSVDSWGEDLIVNIRDDAIYTFDTSTITTEINTADRMTLISGTPLSAKYILVAPEARILLAFGAHDGANVDPLLIRWSDRENYSQFTPTVDNWAGDLRAEEGSEIMTAIYVRKQILVLTDTAGYVMNFIGYPEVYGIENVGTACGAISPHSGIAHQGMAFWMADGAFFLFDGTVKQIPCDIHSLIFKDINRQQRVKIHCGLNTLYNEIWWFFPSIGSLECDTVGVYNYEENVWWYGKIKRSAWVDASEFAEKPYATDHTTRIHQHETGDNDGGEVLPKELSSYDIEIGDGEDVMLINRLINDFSDLRGPCEVTVERKRFPHSTPSSETKTVRAGDEQTSFRMRGRQLSISYRFDELNAGGRIGQMRADIIPHGRV